MTAVNGVNGIKCSGYYACAPEIKLGGGKYEEIAADKAIVDKNIVSAPAWPAHPAFLAEFIKLLGAKITLK